MIDLIREILWSFSYELFAILIFCFHALDFIVSMLENILTLYRF